jgi:hypothetical protein
MTICILIATIGVASLANLVINGNIVMPNTGIFFPPPSSVIRQTSDYGMINGEVTSQSAVAAAIPGGSVMAYKVSGFVDSADKSPGHTENSVISADGHFMLKLPSGLYRITVAYPDGKDQFVDNYAVWPGSRNSLNIVH